MEVVNISSASSSSSLSGHSDCEDDDGICDVSLTNISNSNGSSLLHKRVQSDASKVSESRIDSGFDDPSSPLAASKSSSTKGICHGSDSNEFQRSELMLNGLVVAPASADEVEEGEIEEAHCIAKQSDKTLNKHLVQPVCLSKDSSPGAKLLSKALSLCVSSVGLQTSEKSQKSSFYQKSISKDTRQSRNQSDAVDMLDKLPRVSETVRIVEKTAEFMETMLEDGVDEAEQQSRSVQCRKLSHRGIRNISVLEGTMVADIVYSARSPERAMSNAHYHCERLVRHNRQYASHQKAGPVGTNNHLKDYHCNSSDKMCHEDRLEFDEFLSQNSLEDQTYGHIKPIQDVKRPELDSKHRVAANRFQRNNSNSGVSIHSRLSNRVGHQSSSLDLSRQHPAELSRGVERRPTHMDSVVSSGPRAAQCEPQRASRTGNFTKSHHPQHESETAGLTSKNSYRLTSHRDRVDEYRDCGQDDNRSRNYREDRMDRSVDNSNNAADIAQDVPWNILTPKLLDAVNILPSKVIPNQSMALRLVEKLIKGPMQVRHEALEDLHYRCKQVYFSMHRSRGPFSM